MDLDKTKLIVEIIGGITTIILFIVGFNRYRKDQIWKRKEFVSIETKTFFDNIVIQNCLLMLDWDTRYIKLYFDHPNYDDRFALIGRKEVTKALIPHSHKEVYTEEESIIRDSFDYFLDRLTRFEHFMESNLVRQSDLEPYLRYWIKTISIDLPEPLRSTFHHYVIEYEYNDVIKFFARFNKPLRPNLTLEEILLKT